MDWPRKCVLMSKLYEENISVILPENHEEMTLIKNIESIRNQIEIIKSHDMRLVGDQRQARVQLSSGKEKF